MFPKYELKDNRLFIIQNNIRLDADMLIGIMRLEKVISEYYNFRNLQVDKWFLSSKKNCYKNDATYQHCGDAITNLWFRIIVQTIIDFKVGRPCDVDIWRKDAPPTGKSHCSSAEHICKEDALVFLKNITEEQERFAGLSEGTIHSLIRCKNN